MTLSMVFREVAEMLIRGQYAPNILHRIRSEDLRQNWHIQLYFEQSIILGRN